MTINEQFKKLEPHLADYEIVEIFICVNNWANTLEGKLYAECYGVENLDDFLELHGKLKSLDWCVSISDFYDGGFGIGFVTDLTEP